ncbi:hypothetical protein BC834DRAFT_632548 [Gloeopeniophorella convolvens]|nr:hypothetical protein BC834DRAFT_632548 [Gloeopeniophorella convolvens]
MNCPSILRSHRRLVKQSSNCGAFRGSVAGRTLALLLKCGTVYSVLWALYVAAVAKADPVAGIGRALPELTEINFVLTETIVYIARSLYEAFHYGSSPRAGAIGPPTKTCLTDLLEELPWDKHAARFQPEDSVPMERVMNISSDPSHDHLPGGC